MTTAIILAAGKSERMGAGTDKAFLSLVNKPVLAWSLMAFEKCVDVDRIVLVVRKDQQLAAKAVCQMFGISKLDKIVPGGNRRQDSVIAGLSACDIDTRVVVVHDAARPLVTPALVSEVIKLGARAGGATVGRRMIDTVKVVEKGTTIDRTEPREKLWQVQTPQAFSYDLIRRAYDMVVASGEQAVTDDAQVLELALGRTSRLIEGSYRNLKVTTPEDLDIAKIFLKNMK